MEYLSFDFGDGTVCASRYSSDWITGSQILPPEILHIKTGKQELWSTLAKNVRTQDYIVGVSKPRNGFELELNWKTKPSQRDDGWKRRRELTVLFMERVFKLFLNANPDYNMDNGKFTYLGRPCKIAIGVPCDWSDSSSVKPGEVNDIDEYKMMAKDAGLGDVHVFKEAQAAVLYARRFMGDGLPDKYIENGTLLIDIGSSTTDFTYLKGDKASNRGLTLGAKYVEQSFLGDAMNRVGYEYYKKDASLDTKRAAVNVRNWNLLEVRGYKEDYFSAVEEARIAGQGEEIETDPLDGTELQIGNEDGYLTSSYVETCLNDITKGVKIKLPHLSEKWAGSGVDKENTWRGIFKAALSHLCQVWEIDSSEVTIVVTGGASRMQFVREDIEAIFGKDVRYLSGDSGQQSFSVVKGLAWASYATDLIAASRGELKTKISSFLSSDDATQLITEGVVSPIAMAVSKELTLRLSAKMGISYDEMNTKRKIKEYAQKVSKESVETYIRHGLLAEIRETISRLLKTKGLSDVFVKLQEELGRVLIYKKLPPVPLKDIPTPSIRDLNLGLDSLFNGLAVIIATAILVWILGPFAFIAAPIFAAIFEPKDDDVLDKETVSKVAQQLNTDKAKEEMKGKIVAELKKDEKFMNSIRRILSDSIVKVKSQELDALEGIANYRD